MGGIKNVRGTDVYVKCEFCEESLRELLKHLKTDNATKPLIKHTLTKWQFLSKDCLPLLVMHTQDKRLAFLTLMMLVKLTEMPAT